MTTQFGFGLARTWAIGLLVAVALVLLYLVVMGLRNRTIAKLGVRNIPPVSYTHLTLPTSDLV